MTPIEELRTHVSARAWRSLVTRGERYGVPEFATVEQVAETPDHALLDLRNMGPKMLAEVRAGIREVLDAPSPAHEPRRGSDVEAWIKRRRDEHDSPDLRARWFVLDDLLDDYRLHADCGVPLHQEVEGPTAPGEE
jgi:hypothetical protein